MKSIICLLCLSVICPFTQASNNVPRGEVFARLLEKQHPIMSSEPFMDCLSQQPAKQCHEWINHWEYSGRSTFDNHGRIETVELGYSGDSPGKEHCYEVYHQAGYEHYRQDLLYDVSLQACSSGKLHDSIADSLVKQGKLALDLNSQPPPFHFDPQPPFSADQVLNKFQAPKHSHFAKLVKDTGLRVPKSIKRCLLAKPGESKCDPRFCGARVDKVVCTSMDVNNVRAMSKFVDNSSGESVTALLAEPWKDKCAVMSEISKGDEQATLAITANIPCERFTLEYLSYPFADVKRHN
jgi:hypothetical protein